MWQILKQHLKRWVGKLKLGQKCLPNDQWPNQISSQMTEKSVWNDHSKVCVRFVCRVKNVSARWPTKLTQLLHFCQEEWEKLSESYCLVQRPATPANEGWCSTTFRCVPGPPDHSQMAELPSCYAILFSTSLLMAWIFDTGVLMLRQM